MFKVNSKSREQYRNTGMGQYFTGVKFAMDF